ncbi:Alpha/beta hydrolase family protein [Agreia bicolorata]|uniref:Alpha/beta hydrolase family protein n=1 Tax=Agreia bicolorata TaxID=110935 RepID=A0A1T4YCK3_9MICO|nr:alpha/beta fold hydrolase [Agreia bicolorata]SKA99440.1 Alpha/beta hydrolase family protein [Agreia bicolorata]
MTENQIFEPDARAISYAVEGNGPTVVLVADTDLPIDYLGTLAHILVEEDFRVLRIAAGSASAHDLARSVVDIMDAVGIRDAWLGGHGFGGSVARAVALDFHDRVNGVLLLGVEAGDLTLAEGLPVLVIQGSDDDVTPPANGEALQAAAPDRVSVVSIDGGGHMFPSENVGATSWAIEDYLDWD